MPYQFATEDLDYSDYSSGRVIYSLPGLPAFPVRLASEILQRASQHLPAGPVSLYDPTCGGAYHLAALGLLHSAEIASILASDIDERALELARRNLSLLSPAGLDRREAEIRALLQQYGKPSHAEALQSIMRLRARLRARLDKQVAGNVPIPVRVFQANALDRASLQNGLAGEQPRLVISDIPYGQLSAWRIPADQASAARPPAWQMLDALLPLLPSGAIIAIAADKSQKLAHEGYKRIERFQVGKRQVSIFKR